MQDITLASEIFKYIKSQNSYWNILDFNNWLKNQFLRFSTTNPELQRELFRFVDVLPSLKTPQQRINIFCEYLSEALPKQMVNVLKNLSSNFLLESLIDSSINSSVSMLAKAFIAASNEKEASKVITKLASQNLTYTLDVLGELAITESESEKHFEEYIKLIESIPAANLSIKLSSLVPQINPLDYAGKKQILKNKLRNIYRLAQSKAATINVDSEHYGLKDFTFEIIQELLIEDEFKSWSGAGIVIQAYLKDSEEDLKQWIHYIKNRQSPITIRLVKGAYWDYEKAIAEQKGWDCPVYEHKYDTDINYEKLSKILLDNYKYLRPAIASHNIRSITEAINYADKLKIDKKDYEFQMLYGMMDSFKSYLTAEGFCVRVYLPCGELIPGMSYLVRRLLENTANDSFIKQGIIDNRNDDLLISPQQIKEQNELYSIESTIYKDFQNSANLDLSINSNREKIFEAIQELRSSLNEEKLYPIMLGEEKIYNDNFFESCNPARPQEILGRFSHSTIDDCDKAIQKSKKAFLAWSKFGVEERANLLKITAGKLRDSRYKFNALLCLEAGKPWLEADSEVSEAIDFLEYYASQALELFENEKLRSFAGERNTSNFKAYGVSVVISPWNFPLAIMAGMASASLVAGNPIIIKPSQDTPLIAYEFIQLINSTLREFYPKSLDGLVSFLTGEGKTIGAYLSSHPEVKLVAFTGSNQVGMEINQQASLIRPARKIIAEMGGKNAIIIDSSADLDEAIPGVIYSAFAYAGQKCSACSRLIILEDIYDEFISRLKESLQVINIGDPSNEACFVPPQISINAQFKIQNYINLAKKEARILVSDLKVPDEGYYISPTIVELTDSNHRLAQEEIFGPLLTVFKARNIEEAIDIANNTIYGLTGGLYSRTPSTITKIKEEFAVGNLYINRPCTGAIVSRQAFGGLKQSSIGFKAGGPNYLLQFVQEQTITENTMRRGFVD